MTLPLERPFSITGHTFINLEAVVVTLTKDGHVGRGEGDGVYFLGESQDSMLAELESVRQQVEAGLTRAELQDLLPAGGARNALDCALWDLESKSSGQRIWKLLGMQPKTLTTVATVGMGTPEEMAARALEFSRYPNLKIKLDNNNPVGRLEAIRAARPDATLVIDVNQGWEYQELIDYLPDLERLKVAMIEQPLRRAGDERLAELESPIPIGADESCLTLQEYHEVKNRYQVINIKLDKTGGLTEALRIVEAATKDGKKLMVGNMTGSSLSMAAAYVIGQFCSFVDIDGPLLLDKDIEHGLQYLDAGVVGLPSEALWG
ncbi:MAG: dipeptide epimerase [Aquiluna sp.]|nr:dipeptide epimerase [Aquiluna sp.]